MRITGGQARGIHIHTGRAKHVRPATDRVREAVFSSIRERVPGARVLDLFAGSGSYGLEAVSRGAAGALFVEKHPQAVQAIEDNIRAVQKSLGNREGKSLSLNCIRRDALRFNSAERFDLIFMDPPYELARLETDRLLKAASELIADEGILVFELPADLELNMVGWECQRRLGKSGPNEPSVWILSPGR